MKSSSFHSPLFKLFVVLSLADFGLTTWLLMAHPEWVVESNPVANWWLTTFGLAGMAGFKIGTVGLVGFICYSLKKTRPHLAQSVLGVACLTVLTVVGYSVFLGKDLVNQTNQMLTLEKQDQELDLKRLKLQEYTKLAEELCMELATDKTTLRQAVSYLVQTEFAQDPAWMEQMKKVFNSKSIEVCVAKNLIERFRYTFNSQDGQIVEKLEDQLRKEFAEELQFSISKNDSLSF